MISVSTSKYNVGTPENYQIIRDRVFCLDEEDGYWNFLKIAWHVIETKPLKEGWYMRFVCQRAQQQIERIARGEEKDLDEIFCLSPRTGKSSLLSIFLNAWAWTRWPWMKFITCSYSADLSVEHSSATKKILESEWYLKRWGDEVSVFEKGVEYKVGGCRLKGKVTEKVFTTSAGGRRVATSVGGTVTGKGADVIIADDLTSVKEGRSEAQRKAAVEFYRETLYNRLDDANVGVRMLMQQRVHAEDVVGNQLKENGDKYFKTIIPAEINSKVSVQPPELERLYVDGLMDPVRFSKKVLAGYRAVMHDYEEQYLQNPKGAGGDVWNKDWFFEWDWNELTRRMMLEEFEPVWHFEFDGAYTKKKENAANVCMAYVVFNNKAYVRAIFRRWLSFTELLPELKAFILSNGYTSESEVRIEPKANGKDLVPALVEWTGINAVESYNPFTDKVTAASMVSPMIKSGRVGFLKDLPELKNFYSEVDSFPGGKADQIDVVTMICNNGLNGDSSGILANG